MDNKNCFYTRNSVILKVSEIITPEDIAVCAQYNLKEGFLGGSEAWLVKWAAIVLSRLE